MLYSASICNIGIRSLFILNRFASHDRLDGNNVDSRRIIRTFLIIITAIIPHKTHLN